MNRFYLWCDITTNTQNYSTFEADSERENGFLPGTPARSTKVNSALRQANLIACALTTVLFPNDQTLDLQSSRADVAALIESTLTNKIKTTKVNNSTNADRATIADYASSDVSKGTIENRLNYIEQNLIVVKETLNTKSALINKLRDLVNASSTDDLGSSLPVNIKINLHNTDTIGSGSSALDVSSVESICLPGVSFTKDDYYWWWFKGMARIGGGTGESCTLMIPTSSSSSIEFEYAGNYYDLPNTVTFVLTYIKTIN